MGVSAVTVIGAGTMGAGIAGEFGRAGYDVRLVDRNEEMLSRGMRILRLAQDSLVKAQYISSEKAARAEARQAGRND